MIDAKQYAFMCASYDLGEPRFLVRFCDHTVGVFEFGPEEAEDVRSYPGVEDVLRLKSGVRIDLDPSSLQFSQASC